MPKHTPEPDPTTASMDLAITSALASFEHNVESVVALVENEKPMLVARDATHAAVRESRLVLYRARRAIDNKRKELKEPVKGYLKAVDEHANALIALIEPTEDDLLARESALAAEMDAAKAEAERLELEALEARREAFRLVDVDMPLWACRAMTEEDYLEQLAASTTAHAEAKRLEEERRLAVERERAEERRKAKEAAEEAARLKAELAEAKAQLERERAAKVAPVEHPPLSSLTAEERVVAEATKHLDVTLTPDQVARRLKVEELRLNQPDMDLAPLEAQVAAQEVAENVDWGGTDFGVTEIDSRPIPPAVSERMAAEAQRQEQITAQVEDGPPSRAELWDAILEALDMLSEEPVDEVKATRVHQLLSALYDRKEDV